MSRLEHHKCVVCGRRFEYGGPDRQFCSPLCDGVASGRAGERKRVIDALNTLPRYSMQAKNYHDSIEPDDWGDYVCVSDIAKLLGLSVDSVLNPTTDSTRGFAEARRD